MKNVHFMGHTIVASEFLIPAVDFACPLPPPMLLAKLHVSLSSLFCVCVCWGGGGMLVHV